MLEGKVFSLIIDRGAIESGNILDVAKAIFKMEDAGIDAFQRIAISFYGYDDIPTEVWEIPEVRKWCHKLINKIPYLFYYIENEYFQTQQTLMISMNDYEGTFVGEPKSPEEYHEEGVGIDELPKHQIKIHIHQKSFREMCSEIRKHARKLGKIKNAEKVIAEMSITYGIPTN